MGLGDKVQELIKGKEHLIYPGAVFAAASLVDLGLTYYGISTGRGIEQNIILPFSNYFVELFGPSSLLLLKAAGVGIIIPLAARVDYIAQARNLKVHGRDIFNVATIYTTLGATWNLYEILT